MNKITLTKNNNNTMNDTTNNENALYSYKFQCSSCGGQGLITREQADIVSGVTKIAYNQESYNEYVQSEQISSEVFETEYVCTSCGEHWESLGDMVEDGSLTRQ